jgi:hypothetical protein
MRHEVWLDGKSRIIGCELRDRRHSLQLTLSSSIKQRQVDQLSHSAPTRHLQPFTL